MTDLEAKLQLLLDEREIARCVYRYCHGVDQDNWELVRSCYHPDAIDSHGEIGGTVDEFLDSLKKSRLYRGEQQHLIGNMLIEVMGDDAVCESYFHSYVEDIRESSHEISFLAGRYVDRLAKRDGEWRFVRRICLMDWTRQLEPGKAWPLAASFKIGSRGGSDPGAIAFRELAEKRAGS